MPMPNALWSGSPCAAFEVEQFRSGVEMTAMTSPPSSSTAHGARGGTRGRKGGAWTPCTHLREVGMNLPVFLMRFLAFELAPQSVLEFGCGLGTSADYVARFAPGGASVTCIEPQVMLREVFSRRPLPLRPTQLAVDLLSPSDAAARACAAAVQARGFDLVYTLEVAEHVPDVAGLVPLLARATRRWLVFSAAKPGQGGIGHLRGSMLPRNEWVRRFEAAGMTYMPGLSALARAAAYPERGVDLARNLFVMRAATHDGADWNASRTGLIDRTTLFPYRAGGRDWDLLRWSHGATRHPTEAALFPELDLLRTQLLRGTRTCTDADAPEGRAGG